MAEALRVTVEGAEYTLDIPADSTVVRAPVQVEFFTEVDRVSAIQRAIGVEETGQWDEATNEQFALWLRVQQATHLGIEESDGWWGPKSEAALAGHIDPDALRALSELRESGRLSKLTYRTDVHNAAWEQVEGQVAERAASPDATDADRALSSTLNGEEPAATLDSETPDAIVTDASAVLQTGAVIAAGTGAYFAGKHFINRYMHTPDADNLNTPRHFADADMDIIPRSTDVDFRPVQEPLDRPFIDGDYVVSETTMERNAIAGDATFEQQRLAAIIGPDATAQDLYVSRAEIELISPPRTIHQAQLFLPGDASFTSAIQQFVQTFFPNLSGAFIGAAANSNEFIARAHDVAAKTQVEIDAPSDSYDEVIDSSFNALDNATPDPSLAGALEERAATIAANLTPEIESPRADVAQFDPAVEAAAREAVFNDLTDPTTLDSADNIALQAALERIAAANAAQIDMPSIDIEGSRPQPFLAERIEIAGAPDIMPDPIDAMLVDAVRQSLFDQPEVVTPSSSQDSPKTVEFDPAIEALAREAVVSDLTSPSILDDLDIIASQVALNRIVEANAARVTTPEVDPYTAPINSATPAPDLEGNVLAAVATVDGQDLDTYFAEGIAQEIAAEPAARINPEFDPEVVAAARSAVINDLTSPVSAPETVDVIATQAALDNLAAIDEARIVAAEIPSSGIDAYDEFDRLMADALSAANLVDSTPPEIEVLSPVEPEIIQAAEPGSLEERVLSYLEPDIIAPTSAAVVEVETPISLEEIIRPYVEADIANSTPLTEQFFVAASEAPIVPEVTDVHLNLDEAPNIFRAGTAADLSGLSVGADLPHLNVGHLTAARHLGNAFVGPADIAIAGLAGAAVLSVSDYATAQRFTAEMLPFVGGGLAMSEGRVAEGMMRFTEDIGGVGLTAALGTVGAGFAGPAGGIGGAAVGMVATVEISNGMRDLARTMGFDVDEGMDSRELTSFIGSLAPVYPQMFAAIDGLSDAERISVSVASVDTALRHSKYTMEGLSSEEAYVRIEQDLAAENSELAQQQATIIDGIAGIQSLAGDRPVQEALADPESFGEIYRYYTAMATTNPEDPAMASAVESLATYNDLALQRTQLEYGQLMVDRMQIAPEISALDAVGPRDEAIYKRYSDIIQNYDSLSAEQQEQYQWIMEAAERYERRVELTESLDDVRDNIAERAHDIAHIEDDITYADAGLSTVTSSTVALEQDALIAQMSEEFGFTADDLREDPSLIDRLEGRYTGSQDFLGSIWGNMTDGETYIMNDNEAGLLAQFKELESIRKQQLSLEGNAVLPEEPVTDIQLEIFRLLPTEETPDMSPATRMLVQAKELIMGTEQEFAEFSLEHAQDQLDFDIRRQQYFENIDYSEQNWREAYYGIEMRPDRFEEILQDLNIEVVKPEGATHVVDYNYNIPERTATLGM